ncbi:cytochrome c oxidase cbb3-type subunit 3 [Bradyrhizobium sp. R2.2-H]|jgi:cytochrome c oxidase cbb3-type subunit 3|uniref:cytochrome-c oxidase, cbb3-type subunit III n=1 Tax=unclassified Bradyrhizobium TaxID=2631580 RepID=UPI001051BD5C|nr:MULTISPECIES: cytochrome-c oxidase, cbb3-type subunit III [unclassified Bradyrhizobium]TCU63999.1 cytochrome c oxidase cbb3-type subunit 3 [Bradyrhizobium sp. Y-H1]TCU65911.1 cytochrome c oxidase cbb3-type subunit 3 [Bradyrhizobium sp. R2.2-H]
MAVEERDNYTGYLTTGHEWNGIKELNTPVPRAVYAFLLIAFLFSVGYWVLMPAWPLGVSYTKGLLGLDQRDVVRDLLQRAALGRSAWVKQIETKSYQELQSDPVLMTAVRQTGRTLFGDNCSVCHGLNATGGPGFPNLTTTSWLWGGDPEALAETIRVGINSPHPDSRTSQMPAFGHDQILQRPDVDKVVVFVRSLSNPSTAKRGKSGDVDAGREIFAANCAACHGEDAKGNSNVGAPNLTDKFWIYGGDTQTITTTLWKGRQGHMPSWEARLTPVDRKILALYLLDQRMPSQ